MISRSSSWPSCLNGWRLLLRSTLEWPRKWLRSKPSLLSCRLPLRLLRKALVVTPLQESVIWLPLVWRWMLSCFFLLKGFGWAPLVRRRLLCSKFLFSMQELESIMESFRQRHSLLEQELIASEQRDLEDALWWSG